MRSSAHFSLSYKGSASTDHSMSVRHLGPAITALGELFDRSNLLLGGEGSIIDIKAGTTRPSSYEINIVVDLVNLGMTFYAGSILITAPNILQLVTTSVSWMKLLARHQLIDSHKSDEAVVRAMESVGLRVGDIELATSASPETNRAALETVAHLSRDRIVRERLQQVSLPLSQDGFDRIDFLDGDSVLESIVETDLPSFAPLPREVDKEQYTLPRKMLTVVNPYLGTGSGQWRLHDRERTDRYDMLDEYFASKVRDGAVEFRAKDVLECQVRYTQSFDEDGNIKSDREILKVLAHRRMNDNMSQSRMTGL